MDGFVSWAPFQDDETPWPSLWRRNKYEAHTPQHSQSTALQNKILENTLTYYINAYAL